MLRIFLIALLVFLNCGDKSSPISVESDPTECLWGYWWGTYQNTNEYGHYGIVFIFKNDDTVSCCEKWFASWDEKKSNRDHIFPCFDGVYAYDIDMKLLVLLFKDIPDEEIEIADGIAAYDGSNSFILWDYHQQ